MKLLNNIGKEILNRAIVLERFGWPPSCMGGVYQPERPVCNYPQPDHETPPKEPNKKNNGHKDLKRSFPYPYLEYTEESFAVFFIIFTADLSHMKRRSLCRTIFDPSCTFLPAPDAAPASCVERSSSPVCKNVPSATGTGSSRWKRTKYLSHGHPSILKSLPETHSN